MGRRFLATNSLLQNLRSWRRMEFLRYLDITIGSLKNISKQHLLGCLLPFKKNDIFEEIHQTGPVFSVSGAKQQSPHFLPLDEI